MKTSLKTISLLVSAALFTLSGFADVQTNPVGYTTTTINGTGGSGSTAFSFLSVPLLDASSYSGAISSLGTDTLTVDSATWDTSEWQDLYFVEITSGDASGVASQIIGNTANQLTLADDLSVVASADDTFVIRKFPTLGSFFGSAKEDVEALGVLTSTTLAGADEILLPNGSGGFDFYFFNSNTNPLLGGWRKSGAATTDAADTLLVPGSGFIYKRKANDDFDVVVSGSVQVLPEVNNVLETDFNFISSNYPVEATLLSFFGADGTQAGLVGATTIGNADKILVPNGNGGFDFYYYNTNTNPLLGGWRKSGAATADAKDAVIATPGSSFIVERVSSATNITEARPF